MFLRPSLFEFVWRIEHCRPQLLIYIMSVRVVLIRFSVRMVGEGKPNNTFISVGVDGSVPQAVRRKVAVYIDQDRLSAGMLLDTVFNVGEQHGHGT